VTLNEAKCSRLGEVVRGKRLSPTPDDMLLGRGQKCRPQCHSGLEILTPLGKLLFALDMQQMQTVFTNSIQILKVNTKYQLQSAV